MPTLHWVGKDKVKHHHRDVPYRVLNTDYRYQAPEDSPGNSTDNSIIRGENLEALKSLLPEFEGKVKCIYIDPPYNTGNEEWRYNDNVNDPRIKKWLDKVVGKEGEDLSRHDKWLCMMYPRLKLLHRLLADDGLIFVSIDDNEMHYLRCLMDDIFARQNFLANIVWQKRTSPDSRLNLGPAHDHIFVYSKNLVLAKPRLNKVALSTQRTKDFKNPDKDPRGLWASADLTGQIGNATEDQFFEITTPSGRKILPPRNRCWALAERTFLQLVEDNRIWFGQKGNSRPRQKKFLSESEGSNVWTWWPNEEVGHNQEATKEIISITGHEISFETPKPSRLIERIIQVATKPDDIILDSFAGSGTTAHAVLKLNAQDGGNRRFILIEMMDYAETLTAERVRRVMAGYGEGSKAVAGLGGSFSFQSLGEPLFDEFQHLNPAVGLAAIRDYVAFQECIPAEARAAPDNPRHPYWLGEANGQRVFFCYEPARITALDLDLLAELVQSPGPTLIYADQLALGEDFMRRHNIRFKKIPRDITRL